MRGDGAGETRILAVRKRGGALTVTGATRIAKQNLSRSSPGALDHARLAAGFLAGGRVLCSRRLISRLSRQPFALTLRARGTPRTAECMHRYRNEEQGRADRLYRSSVTAVPLR